MFYLELENQIHLLIVMLFSSCVYFSSLSLKQDTPFTKHIGTAFFIPLVLSVISFLSLNMEKSASYLFFAEFALVTALLLILLVEKNEDMTYLILLFLYALPLGVILLNLNFSALNLSPVLGFILIVYFGIMLFTVLISHLLKKTKRMPLYWGILALCASVILHYINASGAAAAALIIKAAGYLLLFLFFNRTTIRKLEEAHSKNTAQLDRINQSLQREVTRRVEEIERSNRKLVEINKTDPLTGVYTKKAILDMMDTFIQNHPNRELSVLMFDIDNFKNINDSHGHIVGDQQIKSLISIVRDSLRDDDQLGRYGGDEFLIILPDTAPVKACLAAERFRKNVDAATEPPFTISIGIASYPQDASNSRTLMSAADKALYASKKKGKNKVTHFSQLNEE